MIIFYYQYVTNGEINHTPQPYCGWLRNPAPPRMVESLKIMGKTPCSTGAGFRNHPQ